MKKLRSKAEILDYVRSRRQRRQSEGESLLDYWRRIGRHDLVSAVEKHHPNYRKDKIGMLPELVGRSMTPHYSRALRRRIMACRADCETGLGVSGDTTSLDLGISPEEVGFSLSSITAPITKITRKAAALPIVSPIVNTAQKVLRNPVVDTVYGPTTIPYRIGLAAAKGGVAGAKAEAKAVVRNPIRRQAYKAVAVVFPPAIPGAVALEQSNKLLDKIESKDKVEAAKAAAQLGITLALADEGDSDAKRTAELINETKLLRERSPQSSKARPVVCGARSEASRGVWFETNIYREGDRMHMVAYSVASGEPEIFRASIDLRPIMEKIAEYHRGLHGSATVGALPLNIEATAANLGREKLLALAHEASGTVAAKAGCRANKPDSPVSNTALGMYAAARKAVESIDNANRIERAVVASAGDLREYAALKDKLMKLAPAERARVLSMNPAMRDLVLRGIGAKSSLTDFAKANGPEKLKVLKGQASVAKRGLASVAKRAQAGDPKAQKVAAVVSIAARTRQDIQSAVLNARGGVSGIVVLPNGKLVRGRFARATPGKGAPAQAILTKLGIQTGVFSPISGMFGDESSNPDLRDDTIGSSTKICCYGA